MPDQHNVVIIDMYQAPDPGNDSTTYRGFPDQATAIAFASARMRDSVEELRRTGMNPKDLRAEWLTFGVDAITAGFKGMDHLDGFIAEPATPEQRDWQSILKQSQAGTKPKLDAPYDS